MAEYMRRFKCACGCGREVVLERSDWSDAAHYYSNACRQRAYRQRQRAKRRAKQQAALRAMMSSGRPA